MEDTTKLSAQALFLAMQDSRVQLHRARRRLVEAGLELRASPSKEAYVKLALAHDRVAARVDDLLLYEGVMVHRACTGPLGWLVRWALGMRK